jgi:thymidylate kinase
VARALDAAGVRWLILRNHQDLPDRVGHDVDIVVHPADVVAADAAIRAAARDHELFLVRSYRGIEHLSFDLAAADLSGRLLLHVDVQTSMQYRGRRSLEAADLLEGRSRAGGVWIPAPGMEGYALLLHAVLNKRTLKPKYLARLREIERDDPGAIERTAAAHVGAELAARLVAVERQEKVRAIAPELARAVDRRHAANLARRPSFEVRSAATQAWLRLRPRGLFVVFVGPDGSGKSSTVDLMSELLGSQQGVLPVHRVYLGSGTPGLPTRRLARKLRGLSDGGGKAREIRDVSPRRLRGALHVTADEVLRYWVHVRPRLSPHGIVLADRYAYDVFRVNNPVVRTRWFRRVMTALIPTPDLTFFLDGDPQVITPRKKELTVEETIRQQGAYRELAALVPNFRSLDLTVRDDAALRRVGLAILREYAARNHGFAGGSAAEV